MSWFRDIFSWFKSEDNINAEDKTKHNPRRPQERDWTDDLVINEALTKGLYHNTYPGLKLGGAMAFTPIAVPVWFMGLPTPESDDKNIQEIIDNTIEQKGIRIEQLHIQCHREGTIWIYPFYSAKEQKVVWEFIPDETVSDIIRDIYTGEIIELITDEQIKIKTGQNKTANVHRIRYFTKNKVSIKWSGDKIGNLVDRDQRNISGIIPIPFANNTDGDDIRGHSDYSRIITDLKNYHDIELKKSRILAKFNTKLVLGVNDVAEWKKNNSIDDINKLDIEKQDFFFYIMGQEAPPELLSIQREYEAFEAALKTTFRKIVEGSGIPEILWGTKVAGNMGSYENQMDNVVKFVENKRKQENDSYLKLFKTTIMLEKKATMQSIDNIDLKIKWNALDAISEKVKAEIFFNFTRGCNMLIHSAGATKDQLFKLWRFMYPFATEDDFEKFKIGLTEMALHKSFGNLSYDLAVDFSGNPQEDKTQDNIIDDGSGI
jgi:hypothetical protein